MLVGFWNAQAQMSTNACESSPCNAIQICGIGTKVNNYSYTSTGNPQGTCGANFFTNNWVYYRLTCYGSGNLIFTITPNDPLTDLNWAFWNITTTGCGSLSNTTDCNAAVTAGAVTSTTLALTAGSTYLIGIQRASGGTVTTGFSISFTGTTANLTDNVQPSMASLVPFNICQPVTNIKVKLSESVRCSQLDAGDFTITNSPSFSVTASSCPGCVNSTLPLTNYSNYKDTLSFTFTPALSPGTYTLGFNPSSATLPRDVCNLLPNTAPTVTFTVPVPLDLAYNTGFNCTAQTYIDTLSATNGQSPYQFKIKGGTQTNIYSATTVYTGLQGGVTYTLYVKDNNNCEDSSIVTHNPVIPLQSPNLAASASPPCYNQFCGVNGDSITAAGMTSGVSPYTWSIASTPASAMTGATFTAPSTWKCMTFTAGATFTVTVTDALGCTKTASKSLINPTQLTMPTPTGTNPLCYGDSSGSMTVQASGGTGPWNYTYTTWYSSMDTSNSSPSHIGNQATGMPAATYTVSVVDAHGCSTSSTKTLSSNPQIVIKTTNTPNPVTYWNPTCNSTCSGKIKPYATGGVGTKKDFWIYDVYPGTPFDSVKYIGVATVTDSFFYQSASHPNGLCAGSYTVVAKDQAGCTASAVYTLSLPAYPDLVLDSVVNATCFGTCTGKIYTTTNGPAVAPFTYSITPSTVGSCAASAFGTGDYQNLAAYNSYMIIVTKNYSGDLCMDTINAVITEPTQLNFTSATIYSVACNGANTGSIEATASGGTGTITYTINPSGPQTNTTGIFSNLIAQCYTMTATDANGCTATSTACITQPTALTLTISNIDSVTCNGLCDGEAEATAGGGTLPYTYSINSGTIDPVTGEIEDLCATTYTVTVTDGNLCTKTATFLVHQPNSLTAVSAVTQNALCFGDCNGTATVTPSGGTLPYSYTISGPGSPTITNAAGNTGAASNLCNGTYTVTVTDYHSCTTTLTITITQPIVLTALSSIINHPTCANQCNGTATVTPNGGTTPYSYTIVGNGVGTPAITTPGNTATATGLCNDTYTVTVTDAHGCTATTTIHTIDPSQLVINSVIVTDALCNGFCNGTVTINAGGGTPGYSYGLNPASIAGCIPTLAANVYSLVHAGNYTVTTSDANGCTTTSAFTVNEPNVFSIDTVSTTKVSCNGLCDGAIVMTFNGGTGPVTYAIAPNVPCPATQTTVGNFGNLGANVYTITGTDAQGCTASKTVTITQPNILTLSISAGTVPSCTPGCDGTAQANPSGGTPGYTYVISSGASISATGAITGICAGTVYTVTTTDAHGCTKTATISMTTPNGPVVHLSNAVQPTCNPGCDGTVTITVTGGTSPYTYSVNNGAAVSPAGPTATTTAAGSTLCDGTNYMFTVTDANSCVGQEDTLLNHPAPPSISAVTTNVTCNGLCNGTAVISAVGGTGTITYGNLVWQNSMTCTPVQSPSGTFTGLGANTYTVTGTDASGCTGTVSFTITQPTVLTVSVTGSSNPLCNGDCNGSITVNSGGGTGAIGLSINPNTNGTCNASLAGSTFNNLWGTQAYVVTATDANGCTATTSQTLTQPSLFTIDTVSTNNVSCNGLCDGGIVMTYSGGTGPVSYGISPNVPCIATQPTVGTFGNLGANAYIVTGTDANGCPAVWNELITQPNLLSVSVTPGTSPSCTPGCDGTAQANSNGGTAGYTFTITGSANISASGAITGVCAGTVYTVTTTDAHGCTASTTFSMTTPNGPVVHLSNAVKPTCNPGCDGTITITVTGGTSPFTYSVNNGATVTPAGPTATTTATGSTLCDGINYMFTVTDANSCVGQEDTLLNHPAPPTINAVTTNVTCGGLCNGTAVISASGGTGTTTYGNLVWQNAMTCVPVQGPAGTYTSLGANTYTVTGTDASGCTTTTSFTITQPTILNIAVSGFTNPTCNGLCNGSISVNPSGGTGVIGLTINPTTNGTCNASLAGTTFSNLWGTVTYTVTATDANGCTATTVKQITQPAVLNTNSQTVTNASCNGSCNGGVVMTSSGGTPAYTYGITPNAPCVPTQNPTGTFGNMGAGTYTVTATDLNGCTSTKVVSITQPTVLNLNFTQGIIPTCNPGCDGTAQATGSGGTTPYTFAIAGGAAITNGGTITGICSGITYTITVTDAHLCTKTATLSMTTPGGPNLILNSTTDPSCNPGCDGTASVSVVGGAQPFTYSVTNGGVMNPPGPTNSANSTATVLCPAIPYEIKVTDVNSCISTILVTLNEPTPPTLDTISTTPVSCTPGCDGTITMTPVGLTYTLTGIVGQTVGNVANGLCANTTYTVVGTDALGCTGEYIYTPSAPLGAPVDTISVVQPSCVPGCDGVITMTPVNFTYTISPAGSFVGNVASSLCAGHYTVTGTDANGCTNSTIVVLVAPNSPGTPTLTSTQASPYGTANGTITVTNVQAGLTYSISPAGGTQPIVGNFIGLLGDTICSPGSSNNYTITATNALGCTASDTICVMSDPISDCSFVQTNVLCNSLCTGAFDVTASGGVGAFTFSCIPAVATPNFNTTGDATNLCAGVYVVTATDANNGSCQATITITQPAALNFNAPLVNVATCTNVCSGSINITATGGVQPYNYSITSPAAGCQASQASASVGSFTNVGVGTYTVTVTDLNGCTKSTTVVVGPPSPPVINSVLVTDVTCNNACNGQIIVNASNTSFYSIDNGVNSQPSNTFNSVCAGNYTVVATASNGCTATSAVVVTEPTVLVLDSVNATPTTCSYTNNGTIHGYASGGAGAYEYSLDCNTYQVSPIFSNLSAGAYTICVKDANGCTTSMAINISAPPAIVWNITLSTNILCHGASTGSISVVATGGTGTIQYSLNSSPFTTNGNFNNLPATSYTVVASDANSCTLSTTFNLTEPPALSLGIPSVVDNQCFGTSAGSIGINAAGGVPGYTYTINPSPGSMQQPSPGNFTNLPANFYIITVHDTNGCQFSSQAIQVTQPTQLNLILQSQTNIDCNGQATGAIVVSANGGTPGYGYLLQPGNVVSGTGGFNNLTAGTYSLFAIDNHQCTVSIVVTLTEPPAIAIALVTPTEPVCHGDANGTLTISAQGGFPPYQYSLDGGPLQPGGTFVGLVAKWYTILIVDSKGCQHTEQYELTEPEKVGAILDIRDANCINSKDGRIVVTGTGGRGDYSYFIMPGLLFNKSGIFTDLKPGLYHLRVTDISDCEYLIDFTINPPANPLGVSISKQDLGCTGKGFEGQATANVIGGKQPYTYLWFTNPPQTDPVADSLYYGWYNLLVTDAYGCTVKDSVYIQEGPCCDVSFIPNAFSPNGDGNNDIFHVMTTAGIELQQLSVYDRWGRLVWSTNNYRFGWDGKEDGKDADIGNYMYVFRYKCTTDQKVYVKKGDIMLVR